MPFPKAIITKPFLVTDSEYRDLGLNINLVGYDSFTKSIEGKKQHVSPRLINWVEPYEVSGIKKTLFYTEVSSNLQVGERVFIINGTYDNDKLIKKDKYKKGRDGYKVLKVENCKIVLDIDYTGVSPFKEDSLDDYIKVYYIDSNESFVHANRQITTRGGRFDYKFNYGQNNIAFIDRNYEEMLGWGMNDGVVDAPGFFVRDGKQVWSNISDNLIYLGSFSVALSTTYKNNGKILIQNGDFEYNGIQFKEGMAYEWVTGPTNSYWAIDVEYSTPIITKSNFRKGTFEGKFNNGLFGALGPKAEWSGKGTWNGGTLLNSIWKSGTMNSGIDVSPTYRAGLDASGYPFQKVYSNNNGGFGFNYIIGSEIESSNVINGNFYDTSFRQSGSFSVVENHVLSMTQSFDNNIKKAYFDLCKFESVQISGGELKNTRGVNSKFSNVKLVNSYVKKSVIKDSTYIGDGVIKILGYDEWNMSEYFTLASGTFSSIKDVNQKIYKFYISKESFKRLKQRDSFYIRGLKLNDGTKKLLNFFDGKFRVTSWTEFYDDYSTGNKSVTGVDPYSFYKRGYECSAFLSTPEENSHIVNSIESQYLAMGPGDLTMGTYSRYTTGIAGKNANMAYSIDILVARHDIFNKNVSMDNGSEWEAPNPMNYNYSSDVVPGTASLPLKLGNIVDISKAYILDADFESGIIETSDWNSGHHINYNSDVVITPISKDGLYDLEIDKENNLIVANTLRNELYPETIGRETLEVGEVVFLNSVDYDTSGMVTKITLLATGSSYSTTNESSPAKLVNTMVSSTMMSSYGTNYTTSTDLPTISSGSGTGLTVDITTRPIGAVLGITYSAPITGGGSYSMTLISTISINGPITTSFSVPEPGTTSSVIMPTGYVAAILQDDALGTVTGITPAMNGGQNATYSVFGPPQSAIASGATGVGVIFSSGPGVPGGGMTVNYITTPNGAISAIYINEYGLGYTPGQIYRVDGGNATFSIASVSSGEVVSYSINKRGEDYRIGEVLQIRKPYDPNSAYSSGITASVTITGITYSYLDDKGLSIDITTGTGTDEGRIVSATISNSGLYYNEGDIFTIAGGNLDAIVRIDSVTGSVTRLGDSYKVAYSNEGVVWLKELGTHSTISGLSDGGVFYTKGANNRWGYISKTKFDRTKIKSGLFRRAYITKSLIRDINYDSKDKDFANYEKVKNLLVTDTLFSDNSNILSSATYLYSSMVGGSDLWNDGIVFKSTLNGMTFSKGTVKQSIWMDGKFTGGIFYDSRSFDAKPTDIRPNYLSNRARSYFFTGAVGATLSNSRYSWQNGTFSGGEFYKSDWEKGTFENGLFYYSKFYDGTINNGTIGTKNVSASDTNIYNGTINYATVNNAYVYSNDTSYTGMSSSSIKWVDGVFNNGVFGSNNEDVIGTTISNISYPGLFSALPIKDYKITSYTQNVTDTDVILGNLEITGKINLKHTYIGDLIINLMAPNGKIINLKKRYSGGSSDNLIETTFTSDFTKPSLDISTTPHSGVFAFANVLNQGVYYRLDGTLIQNLEYQAGVRSIPQVIDYASFPPATTYEGDRYLVIATSSDTNWTSGASTTWNSYTNRVVQKKYDGTWLPDPVNVNGDTLYIKSRNEYLKYSSISTTSFRSRRRIITTTNAWVKSYHSNTTNPAELLNSNKTITGDWTLIVMDVAGADAGFIDDFTLGFKYKNNYIIKSFRNEAIWENGIFNGGQFIDLGIWKNGKFNNGKFISTYGHAKSGNYLSPSNKREDYSWQAGEFNNGEFGNESSGPNSTWFNGEFNNGVFKGKLWNNGVFTYGEFKGGSSMSAIGGGIRGLSASQFVEQFRNGYYGVWRGGIVSDKKDTFVFDRKIFTVPKRAVVPVLANNRAIFSNMLWLGGTFNHPSGEIKNSVWFDGLFQMGRFEHSSFNPYVKRYADTPEFLKDDSCIWENGKLSDSEFFYSKWKYGQFISGTAVGMIWNNGSANYMNAHNIFWENGIWRNGNWNGSSFEYSGKVLDGFDKEILNRGIEWSGTNSCHIWNIFVTDVEKTNNMTTSTISDTFATDSPEDAGNNPPALGGTPTYILTPGVANSVTITYTIISDGITSAAATNRITHTGIVYSSTISPGINLTSTGSPVAYSGSQIKAYATNLSTTIINTTAIPNGFEVVVEIGNIQGGVPYKALGYAVNSEGKAYTNNIALEFMYALVNVVTINNINNQTGALSPISVSGGYSLTNVGFAAPSERGVVYSNTDSTPEFGSAVAVPSSALASGSISVSIPSTSLLPGTTYYIRTYTRNAAGYGYSSPITVVTGVLPPSVSGTTANSTTLASAVTDMGGSTTLKRGFIVWTTVSAPNGHPNNIVAEGSTSNGNYFRLDATDGGLGAFNVSVSGLSPGVTYKVKAFAYRDSTTFAWDSTTPVPTFTTAAQSPVVSNTSSVLFSGSETTSVTLNGSVSSTGGNAITGRGFVYTNDPGNYPDPSQVITNSSSSGKVVASFGGVGPFSVVVNGLAPGQVYYFKAYCTNSTGTGLASNPLSFITRASISGLSFASGTSSITPSGSISNVNSTISAQGVIWSELANTSALTWWPSNSNPTVPPASNSTLGSITDVIGSSSGNTQLVPNTKYKLYGYVTNQSGTYYDSTYATSGIYTLVFATFDGIATAKYNRTNSRSYVSLSMTGVSIGNGADPVIAKGVQVSTDPQFVTSTIQAATSSTLMTGTIVRGPFSMDMPQDTSSLTVGKKYYYRSYWTNNAGTSYGPSASFATLPLISGVMVGGSTIMVSTLAITNIDADIEEYGLVWSTNTILDTTDPESYTINNSRVSVIPTTNPVTGGTLADIQSTTLAAETTYYARLYVKILNSLQVPIWYYSDQVPLTGS